MSADQTLPEEGWYICNSAVEARFPDRHHVRDKALTELAWSRLTAFPKVAAHYAWDWEHRDETVESISTDNGFWDEIESIVLAADYAVSRFPDDGKTVNHWNPPPLSALDAPKDEDPPANLDALSEVASRYSRSRWATSANFELWLTRQMIFAEAFSFARETGLPLTMRSWKYRWAIARNTVFALVGVGVAISIGSQLGASLGILSYLFWAVGRTYLTQVGLKDLIHKTKLFADMRAAYVLALRAETCPAEVAEALSRAEQSGALWPPATRSVVERALARDRAVWVA